MLQSIHKSCTTTRSGSGRQNRGSTKRHRSTTSREGLHQLKIPAGGSYSRVITGLDPTKTYLFSIWQQSGTAAWKRVVTRPKPDAQGKLTLTLKATATAVLMVDQAELMLDTGTTLPEGWIPENRLGRIEWFLTDHLGSTKLLVDQFGQHRFTGDDDPFGINLRSFGDKDTHRYTGQILDEEQGVYYYGARYYLPEVGRFLSGDPKKQYDSLFNYCGNEPITRTDPSGEESVGQFLDRQSTEAMVRGSSKTSWAYSIGYALWTAVGFERTSLLASDAVDGRGSWGKVAVSAGVDLALTVAAPKVAGKGIDKLVARFPVLGTPVEALAAKGGQAIMAKVTNTPISWPAVASVPGSEASAILSPGTSISRPRFIRELRQELVVVRIGARIVLILLACK